MRRLAVTLLSAALCAAFAPSAFARGTAALTFDGGTPRQQATVRAALAASSFDWGLVPQQVVVHIGAYGGADATPGNVYVDGSLLDAGRFSWGVVQHELAHQVDFFLLDDAGRALLQQRLGGTSWWAAPTGAHAEYASERFASELAWAYWQSPDNSMSPATVGPESAGLPVAQFKALLASVLGAPALANDTRARRR